MVGRIGTVSLRGLIHPDFQYGFLGAAGLTKADEGKVVTLDTTVANTVKLAKNGDPILGRLEVVEVRTQEGTINCTVSIVGGMSFPVATAAGGSPVDVPVVGGRVEGAEDDDGIGGFVKAGSTGKWLVVEVAEDKSYVTVIKD